MRAVVVATSLILLGVVGIGYGVWSNPYLYPQKYYATIRQNAGPLIEALDRYSADHGKPPHDLGVLVPEYIDQVPATGYPGQFEFEYVVQTHSRSGKDWYLIVHTDAVLGLEPDLILYNSGVRAWAVDD